MRAARRNVDFDHHSHRGLSKTIRPLSLRLAIGGSSPRFASAKNQPVLVLCIRIVCDDTARLVARYHRLEHRSPVRLVEWFVILELERAGVRKRRARIALGMETFGRPVEIGRGARDCIGAPGVDNSFRHWDSGTHVASINCAISAPILNEELENM